MPWVPASQKYPADEKSEVDSHVVKPAVQNPFPGAASVPRYSPCLYSPSLVTASRAPPATNSKEVLFAPKLGLGPCTTPSAEKLNDSEASDGDDAQGTDWHQNVVMPRLPPHAELAQAPTWVESEPGSPVHEEDDDIDEDDDAVIVVDRVDPDAHPAVKVCAAVDKPPNLLRDLQASRDRGLLASLEWRNERDVVDENLQLAEQLQALQNGLEEGSIEESCLAAEADHWSREHRRLQALVETTEDELTSTRAQAREKVMGEKHAVAIELAEQDAALAKLRMESAEMTREEQQHVLSAAESRRHRAELSIQMERQAILGPAGAGTAHLFVGALGALDPESLARARGALDSQILRLEAGPIR